MICRINVGAKPAGAVYYNEDKVQHGQARFLGIENGGSHQGTAIGLAQKVSLLEAYADMNPRITKPTFHTSIAFHPSEKLSDEKLKEISRDYMERMGFGNQPYLVYRHEDTHHPHLHIVSVSVDEDGKAIAQGNNQYRSNAIRKSLEKQYGLVEAEKQGKEVLMDGLLPEQILSFNEPEAKKAIGNVVRTAMSDYNFSNLTSFSAFLHQHKIQLNLHQGQTPAGTAYRGLSFQLTNGDTDRRGSAIGPAIKASSFGFAPTIDRLEAKFKRNANQVSAGQSATLHRIQSALSGFSHLSEADFKSQLRTNSIQLIDTGKQYVYVDHKSRNVFDENELGALYSRATQQSAFSERTVKLPSLVPRDPAIRTAIPPTTPKTEPGRLTRTDKPLQPGKPVEPIPPIEPTQPVPVPKPPNELSEKEAIALRGRVSHVYQQVRTQGLDGKPAYFFESQLIRQFPVDNLTQRLLTDGVRGPESRGPVRDLQAETVARDSG